MNAQQIKPCTMAKNMVNLHYGKGRRSYANERRGIKPTLEGARLATQTTPKGRQKLYLCATDHRKGDICLTSRQLVRSTTGGSLREDQASLWSVTASRQSFVVLQATNESLVRCRYLVAYYNTMGNRAAGRVLPQMGRDFTKVNFTSEELRECYIDKQMSQREIAQFFHVDVRKVRAAMQRWDIPVKENAERAKINQEKLSRKYNGKVPPRGPQRKCPAKEVLYEYRFKQGMSLTQIAKLFGVCRQTVRNALRGYEPSTKSHHDLHLYYDSKWERGVLTLYREYLRGAALRRYSFELTVEQFYVLVKGDCYYCGKPPSKRSRRVLISNGIDRIDSTQGYTVTNTRSCCGSCNHMKGSLSEQEFTAWIFRAADHLRTNQSKG